MKKKKNTKPTMTFFSSYASVCTHNRLLHKLKPTIDLNHFYYKWKIQFFKACYLFFAGDVFSLTNRLKISL